MSAAQAVSAFGRSSGSDLATGLIGRLSQQLRSLLHPNRLFLRSSDPADELILAHHGPVAIRQTLAVWSLETCVKGEPDQARETALRRLDKFANGQNRSKVRLRVARPVMQSAESHNRWRVRIAVPEPSEDVIASSARNGKVRLQARSSETLAVISVPGRLTKLAVQHAETAIRHAITVTQWQPAGGPILRLHSLPTALPFLSRFEVAVPVTERSHEQTEWTSQAVHSQALALDLATPPSPPVH